MIKRIVCFLSAVIVMTSSVFAWDAYSFIGVYNVQQLNPTFMSEVSSPSLDSVYHVLASSAVISPNQILSYRKPVNLLMDVESHFFAGTISAFESSSFFSSSFNPPFATSPSSFETGTNCNIPYSYNLSSYDDFQYKGWVIFGASITFDVPVPSGASAVSLSFSPDVWFRSAHSVGPFNWASDIPCDSFSVDVYFNGSLYYSAPMSLVEGSSLSPRYNLNLDLFMSGHSVDSLSVVFRSSGFHLMSSFADHFTSDSGSGQLYNYLCIGTSDSAATVFDVSFLSPDAALDADVDQAQDDINNHESIESQWTGSMSSNFDALDMDSFTFPSGLLSGFSLITGIFQDLWNGMGDYKILYVFPLFLGIALLLIGRISKFSGGQSSSRSNRGDDDA